MEAQVSELVESLQVRPAEGADCFEAFPPVSEEFDRVFGGVVLAYAANAAHRTVEDRALRFHSLHAHFLRPVAPGRRVELAVERWRDGRSFATRQVTIVQDGKRAAAATASFHVDEPGDVYQLQMDPEPGDPETLPLNEWHRPLESRDAGPVLAADGTYRSTGRTWFRLRAAIPDSPALRATLLAYLSDMTGSSFRPLSLEEWGNHTDASIDHAMWVHRPARVDDWLFYDLHAVVNSGARSLVRGCLFDSAGRLCMSVAQELLIRRLNP